MGGLLLSLSCLSAEVFAQANLQKWVDETQRVEDVDVTVISKRDPNTKKLKNSMISISFKDKPDLVSKIYEAARKDRDNASSVTENKQKGRMVPSIYEFTNPENEYIITKYIFTISKDGKVNVVVREYDRRHDG